MTREQLRRVCGRFWRNHKLGIVVGITMPVILASIAFWFGWWNQLKYTWSHYYDIIMAAGALLSGVLALLAAIILEIVRQQISTRYIGEFPEHLDKITAAIKCAGQRIDCLADCVDYGSFFRPEAFEVLRQAVYDAHDKRRVKVRMLVCGDGAQAISAASYWHDRQQQRLDKKRFQRDIDHYLKVIQSEDTKFIEQHYKSCVQKHPEYYACVDNCMSKRKFDSTDSIALDRLLLIRQGWFFDLFNRFAQIKHNTEKSDVFLWLIDGVEAVFLFIYPRENALAFFTHDPGLIRVLKNIFEAKWRDSDDYTPPQPPEPNAVPLVSAQAS